MAGGPKQVREREIKNGHFFLEEGGAMVSRNGLVEEANGAQGVAQGKGKQALQAWLKRWSVCVCVCMRSSTHASFH